MSEVVPLPSFGEVFFDARGQERCLRVTWHEGTLVLSLWRGEMCTASFRMPLDDVGRLLDTLDEGYAEATGEHEPDGHAADVPAADPAAEVIPGTGTYHRPAPPPLHDERPAAPLGPNDVLVARGNPNHQDKLVASRAETTPPHAQPFAGPQYAEQANDPFTGPQYAVDAGYRDPYSGPQYVQHDAQPFAGPQYADEPAYQLPGGQPPHTDPLGFPSQARPAEPAYEQRGDSYGGGQYQQQAAPPAQPRTSPSGGAGLGTPMHGIPGAGRRQDPFRAQEPTYGQEPAYGQDPSYGQDPGYGHGQDPGYAKDQGYAKDPGYGQDPHYRQDPSYGQDPGYGHDSSYGQDPGYGQNAAYGQERYGGGAPNPVDPLLSMGQQEPDRTRPYLGEPLFSTGERLRPDQQYDDPRDRREW
ncbi:hypothetical protein AB0K05_16255 [Nonomuraea sp. NPDC049486]|uniref:hypothetical protein n=1 Tax=Nonomuraea sp. NPDC049486 TaxID=3155773 RepID=UPI0034160A7E